jgi:hypothetical protein
MEANLAAFGSEIDTESKVEGTQTNGWDGTQKVEAEAHTEFADESTTKQIC